MNCMRDFRFSIDLMQVIWVDKVVMEKSLDDSIQEMTLIYDYFWWVSAVTGISLKTRVKISFQCRNCCTLVDLRTTYICPSGVSWISLVWICLVVLFDQTFILFSN
jgi:hypothetical protein